jgi:hypothetical protein
VLSDLRAQNRTVSEIARLLDVSRQHLYKVTAGEMPITPDMAARIGKLVTIDLTSDTAVADSEGVDFVGEITRVDCAGQTLTMLSANRPPGDMDLYLLRLDTSSVVDSKGNPVGYSRCAAGKTRTSKGWWKMTAALVMPPSWSSDV